METNNDTLNTPGSSKTNDESKPKRKVYEHAAIYIGKGGRKLCAGFFKKRSEAEVVLRKLGVHKRNFLIERVEKGEGVKL